MSRINRRRLEAELLKIGFHASNNGFKYIVDAVEYISSLDEIPAMMPLYEAVAEMNDVTKVNVERCIRHEISRMYNKENVDWPEELTPDSSTGYLKNNEFLVRLTILAEWRWK